MITIRASSLPLIEKCVGAIVAPTIKVRDDSEPARLGTAVHSVLARRVLETFVPWSELPRIAKEHRVDHDELRFLSSLGSRIWEQVWESFPAPQVERSFSMEVGELRLTGHVDIVSHATGRLSIADWKTGRKDSDYRWQLMAYSALAMNALGVDTVSTTVLWVRSGETETVTYTRRQLTDWLTELVEIVTKWDGSHTPGEHCEYCPRAHECQARIARQKADLAVLQVTDAEAISQLPPARIVELHSQAKQIETMAKRVKDAIREHVLTSGDVSDGSHVLTMETEARRELVPANAWPVLEGSGFTDEDFSESMKLSISKVEGIVAKKAGRGNGKKAIEELRDRLAKADALSINETKKLTVKRAS